MPTDGTTETTTPPRPWLTPKELAIQRGIDVHTVYGMIRLKLLRTKPKFGTGLIRPPHLIDPDSVDSAMAQLEAKRKPTP